LKITLLDFESVILCNFFTIMAPGCIQVWPGFLAQDKSHHWGNDGRPNKNCVTI